MISKKTEQEISIMKEGGQKLATILEKLIAHSKIGGTTTEIDEIAEMLLRETGGNPSFKGYQGFPGSVCVSVNEGLVHGVPNNYILQTGDILSIDIGLQYKGYHTDMARTIIIGENTSSKKLDFLKAGKESLNQAINQAVVGNRIGDISHAMQECIEKYGYSVSRTFTGHGVGKKLHEDPSIPCFGKKGTGPLIKENMVFAIEVIYAENDPEGIIDHSDGWTIVTKDKSLGGLFENTVAITQKGPLLLTAA